MCAIITSITEQCSLLLALLWGAGPMALMLWLDGMMMMMMMMMPSSLPLTGNDRLYQHIAAEFSKKHAI
jgi:hypothetical protein